MISLIFDSIGLGISVIAFFGIFFWLFMWMMELSNNIGEKGFVITNILLVLGCILFLFNSVIKTFNLFTAINSIPDTIVVCISTLLTILIFIFLYMKCSVSSK